MTNSCDVALVLFERSQFGVFFGNDLTCLSRQFWFYDFGDMDVLLHELNAHYFLTLLKKKINLYIENRKTIRLTIYFYCHEVKYHIFHK